MRRLRDDPAERAAIVGEDDATDTPALAGSDARTGVAARDEPPSTIAEHPERPTPRATSVETPPRLPNGVEPRSDLGNAHRLVAWYGDDLRHDPTQGWRVWRESVWRHDDAGAASVAQQAACRLHMSVLDQMRWATERAIASAPYENDSGVHETGKRAQGLLSWSRRSQNSPKLRAALALAATVPPIACGAGIWDSAPMLLGVPNGTVDLVTGRLREAKRADYITRVAGTPFDPNASAPTFERFLAQVLPSEPLRQFVWRSLGYSLTGLTTEQCFYLLHGSGANGKSTLLEAILHVLGDYSATTTSDTLMAVRQRGADNDLARLRGVRFVSASESGEQRSLDEERVKRLTGGDTVAARRLYKEPFEFRPAFKLWLASNYTPQIRGTDHGMWRRVRLVPFEQTISAEDRDPQLAQKLRAEAPGILAWMVRGCLRWQKRGADAPLAVLAATDNYRAEQDVIGRFVAQCCVEDGDARCPAGALNSAFTAWCAKEGEERPSPRAFAAWLRQAGFSKGRTKEMRHWCGLRLAGDVAKGDGNDTDDA